MLVACFCGHTGYTINEDGVSSCRRCGRQVHPPEVVVPLELRLRISAILDRIELWVDDDRDG
jgi:hypothetical protein